MSEALGRRSFPAERLELPMEDRTSGRSGIADNRPVEAKGAVPAARGQAATVAGAQPSRGDVDIREIPVEIVAVLGRTTLPLGKLMGASKGERLRLDSQFGQPVELQLNGRLIGFGEIFADPEDGAIGIQLLSIAPPSV